MELFKFIKTHKLNTGFTFGVKAVNEHMIVFSSSFEPTGYGYKYATELNSATKRASIQFATFSEGSTAGMEAIALVQNTFGNNYVPVKLLNSRSLLKLFQKLTQQKPKMKNNENDVRTVRNTH